MKEADKQKIINRYNARLAKHGGSIQTLASGTEERRKIRFDVLSKVGITSESSVFDLGCGFGDFYGYLCEIGLKVDYVGCDINPDLIEIAKKRYPTAAFEVCDMQPDPTRDFDYIVSSSTFNLPLENEDNYGFAEEILKTCFLHARKGVAIDYLSSYVDFKSQEGFHYEPERVFSIAKKITKRVLLRHDYPLFEFCVYLYPDFVGWNEAS